MNQSDKTLAEHYEEFKKQGYTLFEKVYSPESIDMFKKTYHQLVDSYSTADHPTWWFGDVCEFAPNQMLPAVSNPMILDFAEMVMGPFVQLDNLTLAGFPAVSIEEAKGKVNGWHRDRWAAFPSSEDYVSPLSINAISYLQDLSNEYGMKLINEKQL